MAKYNILQINHISSGTKRGLIDMTIQFDQKLMQDLILLDRTINRNNEEVEDAGICTETGDYEYAKTEYISKYLPASQKTPLSKSESGYHLILNETQRQIDASTVQTSATVSDDDKECYYAIQLTPESWLSSKVELSVLEQWNAKVAKMRVIYEFEKDFLNNAKTCFKTESNGIQTTLLPLNDILDLCIKSRFKKTKKNRNVPENLIFSGIDQKTNANIDIYLVLDDYPIDFCQCNNDAYLVTQPMTTTPYYLKTDISSVSQHSYHFQLENDQLETYLYKPVSAYDSTASSYNNYLSTVAASMTTSALIDIFTPDRKIYGIDYNYIVNIDQMGNANPNINNPTIYDNGDIHGFMSLGKNIFNSLYSMQMANTSSLSACRLYCGIQNSQNKVLLKYYDSVDYSLPGTKDQNGHEYASQRERSTGKYPYQKVEYFYPNKMASQAKHKSNLFSIKVNESGLDDDTINNSSNEQFKRLAVQMKRDIFNGAKALADSIAPANTQLFKVYFQ